MCFNSFKKIIYINNQMGDSNNPKISTPIPDLFTNNGHSEVDTSHTFKSKIPQNIDDH